MFNHYQQGGLMLTAIDCMKAELCKVQASMNECVDDLGIVFSAKKYKYKDLIQYANELKRGIDLLTKWKEG